MVHDFNVSPFALSRHSSHRPAIVRAGEPLRAVKYHGCLPLRRVLPFVITRHRDQTAVTFECFAEEWLFGDCLGSRVERRQLQFLERFRPPKGSETPAHGNELELVVLADDRVDSRSGADVVARLRVPRRLVQCESVERDDFFPGQLVGGALAHDPHHIALLDVPATLRPNSRSCANLDHGQRSASYSERRCHVAGRSECRVIKRGEITLWSLGLPLVRLAVRSRRAMDGRPARCARFCATAIYEEARDVARALAKTEAFERSRRDRKRVEMLFAHLKRIFRLGRLRLRGPCGAQFEFTMAAIAQNLRKLARLLIRPPPVTEACFA